MKRKHQYLSYCGNYYCALCAYNKGTIVKAARDLLKLAERYGSLELIANSCNACNFEEFLKGLRWLASQQRPCKGCRFGGGWSWNASCQIRICCIYEGLDFCFQCKRFPCQKLKSEPLLERKRAFISANRKMQEKGIEEWINNLKAKYQHDASR